MRARILALAILLAITLQPVVAARADMAPPMSPPGSNLLPEGETTAVRMLAETVTLVMDQDPADAEKAVARTEAIFAMRNLGQAEERMRARFPLSFADGGNDGYFNFPEIPSITVKVDGRSVPTVREMQPPYDPQAWGDPRAEVPWAVFEVTFPPQEDVVVQVNYTAQAYGYYPQLNLAYVLSTGAGWNGTIGNADIIVRLPYDASDLNVLLDQTYPQAPAAAPEFTKGPEVRWHFEDLEPTSEDNIRITVLAPALWKSVLKESIAVSSNPKDGEAWGRLGKAYKESARAPKGYFREDAAGPRLIRLSDEAYQRCLQLLPRDPLWHYGYADLLWSEYYWQVRPSGQADSQGLLPAALTHLQQALVLDPDNPQALEMLDWISGEVPNAVQRTDSGFVFLALTATPLPPTPYATVPESSTATEPASANLQATAESTSTPRPASEPTAANPVCGSFALAGVLPVAALLLRRRPPA